MTELEHGDVVIFPDNTYDRFLKPGAIGVVNHTERPISVRMDGAVSVLVRWNHEDFTAPSIGHTLTDGEGRYVGRFVSSANLVRLKKGPRRVPRDPDPRDDDSHEYTEDWSGYPADHPFGLG